MILGEHLTHTAHVQPFLRSVRAYPINPKASHTGSDVFKFVENVDGFIFFFLELGADFISRLNSHIQIVTGSRFETY